MYLLDDPLAAVDAHVARHLYTECITGLLRNTTRILVTHHVQFLHAADFVVVVDGGKIRQIGRYFVYSHCRFVETCCTILTVHGFAPLC